VDVATLPVVSAEGGARSAPASPQPSSVAAQPASDIFAALEKLAELHGKGILSDEEFASKKAELLSRVVWPFFGNDKPPAGLFEFTIPCFKTADDAATARSWRCASLRPSPAAVR
jgi:hypothetical protein